MPAGGGIKGQYDFQSNLCVEGRTIKKGSWVSIKVTENILNDGTWSWQNDGYYAHNGAKKIQEGNKIMAVWEDDYTLPNNSDSLLVLSCYKGTTVQHWGVGVPFAQFVNKGLTKMPILVYQNWANSIQRLPYYSYNSGEGWVELPKDSLPIYNYSSTTTWRVLREDPLKCS